MQRKSMFIFSVLMPLILLFQLQVQAQEGNETYRPQIHFSPDSGWMSDPNGMVYFDGEYHLFYQHMPNKGMAGTHWGHAASKDLLHWEHLPIALYPDSLGFIFSGSCVADLNNTSGLGTKENPPMIAIFTYHDQKAADKGLTNTQSQAIAYSINKGRSWIKYNKNPVLPNPGLPDFRDPKVIWDEQRGRWLMALSSGPKVRFYGSANCIDWTLLSEFGEGYSPMVGPWECPDFFPLKVMGTNQTKWVLIASLVDLTQSIDRLTTATQYLIGDFDGTAFTTDQKDTLWIDYGKDCYAGVTFANAPNNKAIFMAWMQSHQYGGQTKNSITHSWAGAATFPRELSILQVGKGYKLHMQPIEEISTLYNAEVSLGKQTVGPSFNINSIINFKTAPIKIDLSFETRNLPAQFGITLKNDLGENIRLGYNSDKKQFFIDRTKVGGVKLHERFPVMQTAPYVADKKAMEWTLLIDKASVEFFAGGHTIVFTDVFYPTKPFDIIELFSEGGTVTLEKGTVKSLKSTIK